MGLASGFRARRDEQYENLSQELVTARRVETGSYNRRIDSINVLRDEVAAWQASRDRLRAKVNWQLTTDDARILERPQDRRLQRSNRQPHGGLKRLYPTFEA